MLDFDTVGTLIKKGMDVITKNNDNNREDFLRKLFLIVDGAVQIAAVAYPAAGTAQSILKRLKSNNEDIEAETEFQETIFRRLNSLRAQAKKSKDPVVKRDVNKKIKKLHELMFELEFDDDDSVN